MDLLSVHHYLSCGIMCYQFYFIPSELTELVSAWWMIVAVLRNISCVPFFFFFKFSEN